jgi:uncharacterized membrane protein
LVLEIIRLVTVHPALVHFTIGALPIIVVAYGVASWTRSEKWTFVGDVALAITAPLTVLTAVFGLVAYFTVGWPGGLETWSWLHLALGALATSAIVALAIARMRARRRSLVSGTPTFAAAGALAALVLFTGWIGGEVLVFHSGMAVKAAASGSLAPPLARFSTAPPRDLEASMDRVRAAWSEVTTRAASMIVHAPTPAELDAVERAAREIETTARWIETDGAKTLPNPGGAMPALHDHPHDHAARGAAKAEAMPSTRADHLVEMARDLEAHASAVASAAHAQSLDEIMRTTGQLGAECAGCHVELRW